MVLIAHIARNTGCFVFGLNFSHRFQKQASSIRIDMGNGTPLACFGNRHPDYKFSPVPISLHVHVQKLCKAYK